MGQSKYRTHTHAHTHTHTHKQTHTHTHIYISNILSPSEDFFRRRMMAPLTEGFNTCKRSKQKNIGR